MDKNKILEGIFTKVKNDYVNNQILLTFDDFLTLFTQKPNLQARNSAEYMQSMFEFFGTEHVKTPYGAHIRRFKLFDMEFEDKKLRIVGQERTTNGIYQTLKKFKKEGLPNKLILLHGPNGSAKSSIVSSIIKGLEHYSKTPDGAIYKYNWIFPIEKYFKSNLGLSSTHAEKDGHKVSFAHLSENDVAARLQCDMKDHPLLLIPKELRRELLRKYLPDEFISEYLWNGELCPKCKMIEEALLTSYNGDFEKVLSHIQVERFFISGKYRKGAVTIEPQMHVDAQYRQLTMDKSFSFLPASLQSLSLYELSGELISGNRGIVEFSDILKRPADAFKYLLGLTETGIVGVGNANVSIDAVLIASANELQLDAFKEYPDFISFKARTELVRVPYILKYREEKNIYDLHLKKSNYEKHISPHLTELASLWAILTRLNKPTPSQYETQIYSIIANLTPIKKAKIYDRAELPISFTADEQKIFKSQLLKLVTEFESSQFYEGKKGASPREIKNLIFETSQRNDYKCISPLAFFETLKDFVKKTTEYDYLRDDPVEGYYDAKGFIETIHHEYLDLIDTEIRASLGIYDESQYEKFLEKYIYNVSQFIKNEKVKNQITGEYEKADVALIAEFEKIIDISKGMYGNQDANIFRQNVISAVGAYYLDHPDQNAKEHVQYAKIFPDFITKIRNYYFDEQKALLTRLNETLTIYDHEWKLLEDKSPEINEERKQLAFASIKNMIEKYNYCEHCAREAINYLVKNRY